MVGAYKNMLHYKECVRKRAAQNKKTLTALGLLYGRFPYLESVMRTFRYFCHRLSGEHTCTQLTGLVPDWLSSIIILQSKSGLFKKELYCAATTSVFQKAQNGCVCTGKHGTSFSSRKIDTDLQNASMYPVLAHIYIACASFSETKEAIYWS